ncbi:MAG: zinc-ribbon domain containing protein [bacterium]|nr:zinc-ribbon domain containing protein [bacterium]
MSFRDKVLSCKDCGDDFSFTAGEQEFYRDKGLNNPPKRCPGCRVAKRARFEEWEQASRSGDRVLSETTCTDCGGLAKVPFVPKPGLPVYCSSCFQTRTPMPRGV